MRTALVVLSAGGLDLAQQLQPALDNVSIHGLAGRADAAELIFHDTMTHLRTLHQEDTAIVGLCAAGILIRAIAPVLKQKQEGAPVVALAEDGSSVVPLIGGHHGANALARRIAKTCGGIAALTTAGDVRLGFSLDEPPHNWRVANPEQVKSVMAALLAGDGARLKVEVGTADWLAGGPWQNDAKEQVIVTDRSDRGTRESLVLHPPTLAIGVGCERGTPPQELLTLVKETLRNAGLAVQAVAAIGSLELKIDEAAVHAVAEALDVPARFFDVVRLESERPRLQTPSEIVYQETGCHGVAEGAALALAGSDGELIVAKRKSQRATCAIARAPHDIDTNQGRVRGHLSIVGIGPGDPVWRAPEATSAIKNADFLIGYSRYLDLIADIGDRAERRNYGLGEEADRVRDALTLAGEGHRVALVCSGDAGIYALASLVFETLETDVDPLWRRAEITVTPGISAMQAAAARAGAPLGHDFCAISLSDLMTPREVILNRLENAATGDFVTALYNPQSTRRRDLLMQAKDIFLEYRPESTPVVVARNLGRTDEVVAVTRLEALDTEAVDMLTLVIIGNSETRILNLADRPRVFTPRGYGMAP